MARSLVGDRSTVRRRFAPLDGVEPADEVALPRAEMGGQCERLVRRDRVDGREVGVGSDVGVVIEFVVRAEVEDGRGVRTRAGDQQRQRLAAARAARKLDEGDVVAAGQDPDLRRSGRVSRRPCTWRRPGWDGDDRGDPSAASLAEPGVGRSGRRGLIPPGGMMGGTAPRPASTTRTRRPMSPAARPTTPPPDPSHFRHSYAKDKALLVRRLSRMEGQVRGIARMIEREEYCVDILQQTAALRAAIDSLSILILEDHVSGCVRTAAEHGNADEYVDEVIDVVRRTLGRPVRAATRST